jgi:hypothetical protein
VVVPGSGLNEVYTKDQNGLTPGLPHTFLLPSSSSIPHDQHNCRIQFPNSPVEGSRLSSPLSYAHTMNSDWPSQPHAPAYTPSDSTDGPGPGPTFASPLDTASWGHDGFSHDPGFLASQEELRCMLFTIAQSAAPTRAGSPDGQDQDGGETPPGRGHVPMRPALSNGRRVEYLKNYVGQVAPWVSH